MNQFFSNKTSYQKAKMNRFTVLESQNRLSTSSQVERMLQASQGRSGKQQQEQNSPNLETALLWSPVLLSTVMSLRHREMGRNPFFPNFAGTATTPEIASYLAS